MLSLKSCIEGIFCIYKYNQVLRYASVLFCSTLSQLIDATKSNIQIQHSDTDKSYQKDGEFSYWVLLFELFEVLITGYMWFRLNDHQTCKLMFPEQDILCYGHYNFLGSGCTSLLCMHLTGDRIKGLRKNFLPVKNIIALGKSLYMLLLSQVQTMMSRGGRILKLTIATILFLLGLCMCPDGTCGD